MANVIIKDESRAADVEYIAKKYGIDTSNPEMREAAEVAAARTNEAVKAANTRRRYY